MTFDCGPMIKEDYRFHYIHDFVVYPLLKYMKSTSSGQFYKQIDNADDFIAYHFALIRQTRNYLKRGTFRSIPYDEPSYNFANEICFHKDTILHSKVYHNGTTYDYYCFVMNVYRDMRIETTLDTATVVH